MNNDEAQFLESRRYSVEDIARLFKVPPSKIGSLDKSNYSNLEALERDFVNSTLRPWLVNFEMAYRMKLLRPEEQDLYYVEHDLSATLRGDPQAFMQSCLIGIQAGVFSPNEVRRQLNLDPREGGDIYLQPTNLAISPWNPQSGPAKGGNNGTKIDQGESKDVQG
jgi:HK97 family phage portal protein